MSAWLSVRCRRSVEIAQAFYYTSYLDQILDHVSPAKASPGSCWSNEALLIAVILGLPSGEHPVSCVVSDFLEPSSSMSCPGRAQGDTDLGTSSIRALTKATYVNKRLLVYVHIMKSGMWGGCGRVKITTTREKLRSETRRPVGVIWICQAKATPKKERLTPKGRIPWANAMFRIPGQNPMRSDNLLATMPPSLTHRLAPTSGCKRSPLIRFAWSSNVLEHCANAGSTRINLSTCLISTLFFPAFSFLFCFIARLSKS